MLWVKEMMEYLEHMEEYPWNKWNILTGAWRAKRWECMACWGLLG